MEKTSPEGFQNTLQVIVNGVLTDTGKEAERRGFQIANEIHNSLNLVLRGARSGRHYKIPGTYHRQRDKETKKMRNGVYYTASAPGEAPAIRTGNFRASFQKQVVTTYGSGSPFSRTIRCFAESRLLVGGHLLGEILEKGTTPKDGVRHIEPRPYQQRAINGAMPKAQRIMKAPFLR